jgi:hypothetical protein
MFGPQDLGWHFSLISFSLILLAGCKCYHSEKYNFRFKKNSFLRVHFSQTFLKVVNMYLFTVKYESTEKYFLSVYCLCLFENSDIPYRYGIVYYSKQGSGNYWIKMFVDQLFPEYFRMAGPAYCLPWTLCLPRSEDWRRSCLHQSHQVPNCCGNLLMTYRYRIVPYP